MGRGSMGLERARVAAFVFALAAVDGRGSWKDCCGSRPMSLQDYCRSHRSLIVGGPCQGPYALVAQHQQQYVYYLNTFEGLCVLVTKHLTHGRGFRPVGVDPAHTWLFMACAHHLYHF